MFPCQLKVGKLALGILQAGVLDHLVRAKLIFKVVSLLEICCVCCLLIKQQVHRNFLVFLRLVSHPKKSTPKNLLAALVVGGNKLIGERERPSRFRNLIVRPRGRWIIGVLVTIAECPKGAKSLIWTNFNGITPLEIHTVVGADCLTGKSRYWVHLLHGRIDVFSQFQICRVGNRKSRWI